MILIVLIALLMLTFSLYQKTKSVQEDLTAIREKLGLLRPEELAERELKRAMEEEAKLAERETHDPELEAYNREIEEELERMRGPEDPASSAGGSGPGAQVRLVPAAVEDAPRLAQMNRMLIEDERSSNPMSDEELLERMRGWLLSEEWHAQWIMLDERTAGYLLHRRSEDGNGQIRQLFVERQHRRSGIGQQAVRLYVDRHASAGTEVTVDVLESNPEGMAFWRSAGFRPYSTRLKRPTKSAAGKNAAESEEEQ
ncbi:GNAT family N-acetyltransferase [Paenibacillus pasadenensis]|uniref:GNAT family N-acetyltransferase n=1 Tax=Paenibacillus pasadenensis TaxID=217090 RepID=UPI000425C3CA|nr:GNAT family N-acetyltransferase [Paenibacillus pasadenensis]